MAEIRHDRLFEHGPPFPRMPSGFRAEDVLEDVDAEGFVRLDEAAERMEIPESEVLDLVRSGYLLARWSHGQLLIRPAIL